MNWSRRTYSGRQAEPEEAGWLVHLAAYWICSRTEANKRIVLRISSLSLRASIKQLKRAILLTVSDRAGGNAQSLTSLTQDLHKEPGGRKVREALCYILLFDATGALAARELRIFPDFYQNPLYNQENRSNRSDHRIPIGLALFHTKLPSHKPGP